MTEVAKLCREHADQCLVLAKSAASTREARYLLGLVEALLRLSARLDRSAPVR
jgi:hypothetical protein